MPQHVEMHRERQACALTDNLDLPIDGIRREGRAALSREDVAAIGIFLAERRQHAQLVALQKYGAITGSGTWRDSIPTYPPPGIATPTRSRMLPEGQLRVRPSIEINAQAARAETKKFRACDVGGCPREHQIVCRPLMARHSATMMQAPIKPATR